jgi:hypothetical protein
VISKLIDRLFYFDIAAARVEPTKQSHTEIAIKNITTPTPVLGSTLNKAHAPNPAVKVVIKRTNKASRHETMILKAFQKLIMYPPE